MLLVIISYVILNSTEIQLLKKRELIPINVTASSNVTLIRPTLHPNSITTLIEPIRSKNKKCTFCFLISKSVIANNCPL